MLRFARSLVVCALLFGCGSEADDTADCRTAVNACSSGFECAQRSGAWTCRPEGEVVTSASNAGASNNTAGTGSGNPPVTAGTAEAALTTTVGQLPNGSCSSTRGPLSIGESSTVLLGGSPGVGRVVNGRNGSVACTVASNGTGFFINADINAPTLELNASGVPYQQDFNLHGLYPALTPHAAGALATISSTDSDIQTNRADGACSLDVISLADGTGGALFANFNCSAFADANTPDTECRLTGTIVLENCEK